MDQTIPDGFARHYRRSPVTDPWEPLYSRRSREAVEIGFRAAEAHANSRGFVHGGLLAALADNAMGLSCGQALEGAAGGLVTVSLAVDYVGTARLGQWLQVTPEVVKAGASLCFAQAIISAGGRPCARANGVFKVVDRPAA